MTEYPGFPGESDEATVLWPPNPGPQTDFVESWETYEVFYGGARAGGKSFALLLDWMYHAFRYGADANGLLVRRELTQLKDLIRESQKVYGPLRTIGWEWYASSKTWVSDKGAHLTFGHLENDEDAAAFQGWNLTWFGVEELTTFPRPEPIFSLLACLRSPRPGLKINFRSTGNPGGPGHQWVKARYINPAPLDYKIIRDDEDLERLFIPAKAKDNQYISPQYLKQLRLAAPNNNILKGWLDGDWDFAEGSFFDEFDKRVHVIPTCSLPDHWPRYMALDPGSVDPAAVLWGVIAPESFELENGYFVPKGAVIIYRELYIAKPNTDVGLKLPIEEIAKLIIQAERNEPRKRDGDPNIVKRVAGLDLFNHKNGSSLAETMVKHPFNLIFQRAETARIDRQGGWGGWNLIRFRLQGQDGHPMIYFMDNCMNLIRTLPILQMDQTNPEDVAHCGYDHCADALRYLLQCKPYVPSGYSEIPSFNGYETQGVNSTTIQIHRPTDGPPWEAELQESTARRPVSLKLTGRTKRIA